MFLKSTQSLCAMGRNNLSDSEFHNKRQINFLFLFIYFLGGFHRVLFTIRGEKKEKKKDRPPTHHLLLRLDFGFQTWGSFGVWTHLPFKLNILGVTLDEDLSSRVQWIEQSYWLRGHKLDPRSLNDCRRPKLGGKSRLNLHMAPILEEKVNWFILKTRAQGRESSWFGESRCKQARV